jgi:hypothetical protein
MYVSGKVCGIKLAGGQVTRDLYCTTPEDERTATLRNFENNVLPCSRRRESSNSYILSKFLLLMKKVVSDITTQKCNPQAFTTNVS